MVIKMTNISARPRKTGSAMILVIVLTVLLSLIGILFVMVSRLNEMSTLSLRSDSSLDAGTQSVIERINNVLVDDLFGSDRKGPLGVKRLVAGGIEAEGYDSADIDDKWLADIEPLVVRGAFDYAQDDSYTWDHITDLYGIDISPGVPMPDELVLGENLFRGAVDDGTITSEEVGISVPYTNLSSQLCRFVADADGDGVWDSIWVRVPGLHSGGGKPIYAAVRIIDNCAMLNLNTVNRNDPNSTGRFLSAVDYERFLRGTDRNDDNPNNLRRARLTDPATDQITPLWTCRDSNRAYHDWAIMKIENPGSNYRLFDRSDELEIRNRFLLTSRFEARFERDDVANFTLNSGGNDYIAIKVQRTDEAEPLRDPFNPTQWISPTPTLFDRWKWRMDSQNFDFDPLNPLNPLSYKYDRRHICTFYSFDRNLRTGSYGALETSTYAHYFLPSGGSAVSVAGDFCADIPVGTPAEMLQARKARKRRVLHLLYAFRAYFLQSYSLNDAAKRSAQIVANMIDYIDNSATTEPFWSYGQTRQNNTLDEPTYITEQIVRQMVLEVSGNTLNITDTAYAFGLEDDDIVYGYERQPFISELYSFVDNGLKQFAIELCNPYDGLDISLEGWRIIGGTDSDTKFEHTFTTADGGVYSGSPDAPGYLIIRSPLDPPENWNGIAPDSISVDVADLLNIPGLNIVIRLQRPDPANAGQFITVDQTVKGQIDSLFVDGEHVSERDTRGWKFTDASGYGEGSSSTLGSDNDLVIPGAKGFAMPVADNWTPPNELVKEPVWRYSTLGDFEKVLWIGNDPLTSDPNQEAITTQVGLASDEGGVRFDIDSEPELLQYVCFLSRPQGSPPGLPGRININTATREVIRAAIPANSHWSPSADELAYNIVDKRRRLDPLTGEPYSFKSIADLLDDVVAELGFEQYIADPNRVLADDYSAAGDDVPDEDTSVDDDFEERDWILSCVSNIFTVRSDVFTAYIAIRIGQPHYDLDDPGNKFTDNKAHRRVIAVFDRSMVSEPSHRPRLIALHPAPEVR